MNSDPLAILNEAERRISSAHAKLRSAKQSFERDQLSEWRKLRETLRDGHSAWKMMPRGRGGAVASWNEGTSERKEGR